MTLPALFVSHGAPNMILYDAPVRRFFSALGEQFGKPRAILVFSAHWETRSPAVIAAARPATIHDFYGFEAPLYEMRYAAPGAPALADDIARRLEAAGMRVALDAERGLDHGAWVPLALMYPQADIPVTQISLQPSESTQHHYAIGQALRALREDGVLILGSGNATHNLREMRPDPAVPPAWVRDFADWLRAAVTTGDSAALLDYRDRAPYAAKNHPTEEHFLPLFAPLGAATPGTPGRILHSSFSYGVLAMDAFAFD